MDFYAMKRKRLQSLCKKHGIPANLKNKEMAEKLSLLYKEKENKKGTTFHCVSDKDKLNVEIIELDSDSDDTNSVQMEASDAVAEKDKINVTLSEVKSSELNIPQMVASGTVAGNADAAEVKFVSSEKMSQELEESKIYLPPERRDDIGLFNVEENLHMVVNKEQVSDNQDLNPAAPSADVHVASEEFGNYLVVEGEVEKLSEKTVVHADTCGTKKVGDESGIQDHINSPSVSLLHVSPKESSGCFVEKVHKLDDNICVHGAGYKDSNISEASTMYLDASIGAKDIDGETNVSVEDILDEVHSSSFEDSVGRPVQFLQTDPLDEVNTSDLDVHNMVVPGTATKNVDSCGTKSGSSQKISISPTSEKMIDFSPKLLNNSKTPIDEMGLCDVEENMQIGVNKEEVSHSEEVLHTELGLVVPNNDEDLDVHNMVVPGTATKNVDSCGTKSGSSQKISISPTSEKAIGFSPKLLNDSETPIDEMGLCDVEENMQIGVNKEEVIHSEEVLHAMGSHVEENMQIGVNKEEVSHSEEVLHAMGSDVEENIQIGVNKEQVEHSQEVLHTEPSVVVMNEDLIQVVSEDMQVDDMGVCDVVEHMQVGVNKEQLDHSQEVLHAEPSVVVTNNNEGLVQVASEDMQVDDKELCDLEENMLIGVNKEQVDHNQEVLHTEPSAVVMKDYKDVVKVASEELGNNLVDGEVEKLGVNIDLEDVCGSAKGGDESVKHGLINSPQGSNINDRNKISEAATMCLDASIGSEDTDGKTNVTVEHILDEVYSSSFKDSDGTSVQFLPIDSLSEVKTSDLDVHKMVVQDTCGSNSAKFVSSRKISIGQASEKGIGFYPKLLNNSETPIDDTELCEVEENLQTGVNKEQVVHGQEVLDAEPSMVVMKNDEELVQVASEEFGNNVAEGEVEKFGDIIDLLEEIRGTEKGIDETVKQGGINGPRGSNISPGESSSPLVGEVQKSCENILHGGVYSLGKSGSGVDAVCFLDSSIAAKDTEGKTNVTMEHFSSEGHSSSVKCSDDTPDQFLTTDQLSELICGDLNIHQMNALDNGEEKLTSSQKRGLIADREDCIGFSPNSLEASANKGFEAETYFDQCTFGDVGTCNMKESTQSDNMEKGNSEEECSLVQGEFTRLFGNYDAYDDTGGLGAEDENETYMMSHKRKRSDLDNNTNGPNSNEKEKADEFVSTVPQFGEMESSIAAKDTYGKTNVTIEHFPSEGHSPSVKCSDDTPDQFLKADQLSELMCRDLNISQMDALDTCEEMMKPSQKRGLIADPDECIGLSPNNLEASANKGFEAETYFDQCTSGDVVGTCNMKESDNMEKGNSKEECSLIEGEVTGLFDNYDAHDDTGGIGAEDENEPYMMSHKRKRSDVDDTSDPNSNVKEKEDESVPTMPQHGEMESCNFNLHQIFASGSDTVSGDESTYQEKLESSPKGTPIVSSKKSIIFSPKFFESSRDNAGTCDMKENINFDKKEQFGSIISKKKIAKRQPLQDLQQN